VRLLLYNYSKDFVDDPASDAPNLRYLRTLPSITHLSVRLHARLFSFYQQPSELLKLGDTAERKQGWSTVFAVFFQSFCSPYRTHSLLHTAVLLLLASAKFIYPKYRSSVGSSIPQVLARLRPTTHLVVRVVVGSDVERRYVFAVFYIWDVEYYINP
jgi:hypothetical protein